MRIAISGHSGCGNTTATTNVGTALKLKVINYTFRDLAKELNMSFEDLHREAGENNIFDYMTDLQLIRSALAPNVIVGSRLAAWLMDAELRIWLQASLEVRASRINLRESEKHSGPEAVLYKTLRRDEQNRRRYMKLYGLDINDHSDFDITINTQMLTAEQVSSLVVAAAQWVSVNHLERQNMHLPRIKEIIAENLRIPMEALSNSAVPINLLEIFKLNYKRL